jgi:2-dehydro-3-deoxygluconokinase
MSAPEVVTFGEVMALLLAESGVPLGRAQVFHRHIAGAEANVAVGLARLGVPSRFIGRVGEGSIGDAVVRALRGEGVEVDHVVRDDAPTGVLIRDAHGERPVEVSYHRSGSAGSRLGPEDVPAALIASARLLHVTGITPALSPSAREATLAAVGAARAAGVTVCFDPNIRRRLAPVAAQVPVLRELAVQADLVLAGEDEALLIAEADTPEDAVRWFLDGGAALVVVKRGAEGTWAADRARRLGTAGDGGHGGRPRRGRRRVRRRFPLPLAARRFRAGCARRGRRARGCRRAGAGRHRRAARPRGAARSPCGPHGGSTMSTTSRQVMEAIGRQRIIGIVREEGPEAATAALRTLAEAGLEVAEISLTTPSALRAIEQARRDDALLVGVGTVLDAAAARQAVDAGAQLVVTPTVSAAVIAAGNRYGVPVVAGAATPTEIMTALELGAQLVKLFPASALGPDAVGDILAALPQVGLVPTGGVSAEQAPAYLDAGAFAVGMGSALTRGEDAIRTTRALLSTLGGGR